MSNGSRLFSYADSSSVAITSAGTLSVGTVTAAQQLTVTTTNGGNVFSSAVRQGAFASGFCTGSQVVKNTFPGTATPYNVSASRNLTIVN